MISVVIPTFNRLDFVLRAIESVLGQSYTDLELIVVDDGSTDGTVESIRSIMRDDRLKVEELPHCGVSAARNRGISLARYPWIAFLDSDDLWLREKLSEQIESLERRPEYRVVYTEEIWVRNGVRVNPKKIHQKHSGWIYEQCLPRCIISPSSVLIHRSVFSEIGAFDPSFEVCEDYDLWLRIACRYPVLLVGKQLIQKFGGHSDQLSRTDWGFDRHRIRSMVKRLRSGELGYQQSKMTTLEIQRKAAIIVSGATKRGNWQLVERYQRIASICAEVLWTSHYSSNCPEVKLLATLPEM